MSEAIHQPAELPLNPAIKQAIDEEFSQPFISYFFPDTLKNVIEKAKVESDLNLGQEMVGAFAYVCEKGLNNTSNSSSSNTVESRILAITDQLAWLGTEDDVKLFTCDDRVKESPYFKRDDFLDLVSTRFGNRMTTGFDATIFRKCALVTTFCAEQSTDPATKHKLTEKAKGYDENVKHYLAHEKQAKWEKEHPEEAAARRRVADELRDKQIAEATLRQQKDLERSEAAKRQIRANRQSSEQRLADQKKQIALEPSKFLKYVDELDQAEALPGEISLDDRRNGLAVAVVEANRLGDVLVPDDAYGRALGILTECLESALNSAKETESGIIIPMSYELERVIADIIPDKAALNEWAEKYPVILQETRRHQGGFIQRWQDDVIKRRLLIEATPDERTLAKELIGTGVVSLSFEAGQSGEPGYVGYDSKEDLFADLKSYFLVREDDTPHPHGWYRTAKQVFEDDIVKKLDDFMMSNVYELDNGGALIFKTPTDKFTEYHRGGLYEEHNNFDHHGVTIQIEKDEKGSITYKLMLAGDRYALVNVRGRLIDSFAAYVGRDVEFEDSSKLTIIPDYEAEYGSRIYNLDWHPEKRAELLKIIDSNRLQPVTERHDYESHSGVRYYSKEQTWELPQKSTRYSNLKNILEGWLGQPVTPETRQKKYESVDSGHGIEPWTIVYLRETFDTDGNRISFKNGIPEVDNDTPQHYQAEELGLKNFVAPTTLAQVESMRRVANHMLYRNR